MLRNSSAVIFFVDMVLDKNRIRKKSEFMLVFNQKIIKKIRRIVKMPVDEAKLHFQPGNGFQEFFDLGDNLSIAIQKQFGYRH